MTNSISCVEVTQLAMQKEGFEYKLSMLEQFIDFFLRMLGSTGKEQYLREIHNRIYGNENTPLDKISAMISLKNNMAPSNGDEFHAELVLDNEFFFTGKAKVCTYFKNLPLLETAAISLHDLEDLGFFKQFNVMVITPGDPIASFSKFSTGEVLAKLTTITKNASTVHIDTTANSLGCWYKNEFLTFKLGLGALSKTDSLPNEFDVDKYIQQFESLDNEIYEILNNKKYYKVNELESLLDVTITKTSGLLNKIYASIVNKLTESINAFHNVSESSSAKRCEAAANIVEKTKQMIPFYQSPLFYNSNGVGWKQRVKENDVMTSAMNLLEHYYSDIKLGARYGQHVIPIAAQCSVDNILKLLNCYQTQVTASNPIISIESVNDYDHQYGFHSACRVCLLQDGRILKSTNIPSDFIYLVKNHLIGEPVTQQNPKIYGKSGGGSYGLYQLGEGVSKRSFMADISRYFYIQDICCDEMPEEKQREGFAWGPK